MPVISPRGIGNPYVHLSRGDPFDLNVVFDYRGKPQNATFQLNIRKHLWATQHDCGSNTGTVTGAIDWEPKTATFSFTVPAGVEDGVQDLQLYITAADGERDESDWLNEAIYIS